MRPSRSDNGRWPQPHALPVPLVGQWRRVPLLYVLARAVVPQGFSSLWLSSLPPQQWYGIYREKATGKHPAAAPHSFGEVHKTMLMSRHTTGKLVVSPYRPQNSVWAIF
jgi:hypothetical protein